MEGCGSEGAGRGRGNGEADALEALATARSIIIFILQSQGDLSALSALSALSKQYSVTITSSTYFGN